MGRIGATDAGTGPSLATGTRPARHPATRALPTIIPASQLDSETTDSTALRIAWIVPVGRVLESGARLVAVSRFVR